MKLLLPLFLCLCLHAQTTAIRCGKLLDVRAGSYIANGVILISGQAITNVGPADKLAIPAGATTIDLSRATCLPGLIDVHDHLTSDPRPPAYRGLGVSIPRAALTGALHA